MRLHSQILRHIYFPSSQAPGGPWHPSTSPAAVKETGTVAGIPLLPLTDRGTTSTGAPASLRTRPRRPTAKTDGPPRHAKSAEPVTSASLGSPSAVESSRAPSVLPRAGHAYTTPSTPAVGLPHLPRLADLQLRMVPQTFPVHYLEMTASPNAKMWTEWYGRLNNSCQYRLFIMTANTVPQSQEHRRNSAWPRSKAKSLTQHHP